MDNGFKGARVAGEEVVIEMEEPVMLDPNARSGLLGVPNWGLGQAKSTEIVLESMD